VVEFDIRMYAHPEMRIRDMRAVEISRNLHISPAQFLHSQNLPQYLQLKQSDTKVLSPAQDDRLLLECVVRPEGSIAGLKGLPALSAVA
jgi:hypothetical protein